MGVLLNRSYRACIEPTCTEKPILAIIIEGKSRGGDKFRVATILTCSNHIDEGDALARKNYGGYSREIFDNPPWLFRQQLREEQREEQEGWRRLISFMHERRGGL